MHTTVGENFLIIGHRGAPELEPENTLQSFARAVAEGVDAIELDVQLIDGRLFVLHDETLDRTSDGRGLAKSQSFEALRRLDFGQGARIPLLEEVIESTPVGIRVNVELKGANTGTQSAITLGNYPSHSFMVSSFRIDELENFALACPEVPKLSLALLQVELSSQTLEAAKRMGASAINLWDPCVNARVVSAIRDEGLDVYVYTVNSLKRARTLKVLGASGIFTDAPHRIKHEFLT